MGFSLGLEGDLLLNLVQVDVDDSLERVAWPTTPATGLPQTSVGDIAKFPNVRNLRLNMETGEADITTRASGGFKAFAPTLFEGVLEFESVWDQDDPLQTILFTTAFLLRKPIWGIALDKFGTLVTGEKSQGLWATWSVLDMSRNEDLEEADMVTVRMRVTRSTLAPTWETFEVA